MTPLVWVARDFARCEAVCAQSLAGQVSAAAAGSGDAWQRLTWAQVRRALTPQAAWSRSAPAAQVWVLEPSATGPADDDVRAALDVLQALDRTGRPVWSLVLLPGSAGPVCRWLDAGADRVLPQGVEPVVLGAFLRALLRRAQGHAASQTELGRLRFDHSSATLFHGQQRVLLTARETQLAALFFERGQQLVRTRDILRHLLEHGQRLSETVHVSLQVHRLNRKLRPYGLELVSLRGHGYRLAECPPQAQCPLPEVPPPSKAHRKRPASKLQPLLAWPPVTRVSPNLSAESGLESGL